MALPLVWLADELSAAGLDVAEHDGWATRSDPRNVYDDSKYDPVGVIDHHTAGASILKNYPDEPYWPDERLEDVCNITIRPDGTLSVVNAGIAYDSGSGSRKVYDAVRNDQPLPSLAGLTSDMNGTLYFIDIEVQHLGDGSPIDPRQRDALIRTNAVICARYGWDPMFRVVGHREWAPDRKPDPRWDGTANPMPQIREDTRTVLEDMMVDRKTKADDGLEIHRPALEKMIEAGVMSEHTQPGGVAFNDEFATFLVRYETYLQQKYGLSGGQIPDYEQLVTAVANDLQVVPKS